MELSKVEMIWNEAQMFSRDIISDAWLDISWNDLPEKVRTQFANLVSADIPGTVGVSIHELDL